MDGSNAPRSVGYMRTPVAPITIRHCLADLVLAEAKFDSPEEAGELPSADPEVSEDRRRKASLFKHNRGRKPLAAFDLGVE